MNLKEIYLFFDIYAPSITLYYRQGLSYKTILGSTFSIITIILFIFHFYIEANEVFAKNTPFISYYTKNTISTYKQGNLPLYVFQWNNSTDYDILPYFNFTVINYYDETANETITFSQLRYCTPLDLDEFDKLYNMNLSEAGYCLDDGHYDQTATNVLISILPCEYNTSTCTVNTNLYLSILANETIVSFTVLHIVPIINPADYDRPFRYGANFYQFDLYSKPFIYVSAIEVELITQNPSFLVSETKESYYTSIEDPNSQRGYGEIYYRFGINLASDDGIVRVYNRNYKSLPVALAATLSIMKIYAFVFNIINRSYCRGGLESEIIGRCFDYNIGCDTTKYKIQKDASDYPLIPVVRKHKFKIHFPDYRLNIKRCLCMKKNVMESFFTKARDKFTYQLNIQNLCFKLFEFDEIKYNLREHMDQRTLKPGDYENSNLIDNQINSLGQLSLTKPET
jgi:hypothetical protein